MAERWRSSTVSPSIQPPRLLPSSTPRIGGHSSVASRTMQKRDPDGAGPLVAQKDSGDGHSIVEEYRGYILDGGGYDGQGLNRHTGGHIRLDPARKELLAEVDRAAVLNNVPLGGLPHILDGASKVFSNADRGAGIFMYYLYDEVNLAAPFPTDQVAPEDTQRDALQTHRNADLKTDFFHVFFVDDGIGGSAQWLGDPILERRGVLFTTSGTNFWYGPGPAPWLTKMDEAFMTVLVHELTHPLIRPVRGVGVWDNLEHLTGALNSSDLMYTPQSALNRELATVKFSVATQQEIWVKSNEQFVSDSVAL